MFRGSEMQEIQRYTASVACAVAPPIDEILDFALAAHEADTIKGDCSSSLAYRTPLWSFSRAARSAFAEGATPDDAFFALDAAIARRGGWDILGTDMAAEDIYFEFVSNWDAVRYRVGETPLENAVVKADAFPLTPQRATGRRAFLVGYGRFVSIAGWLQVTMGNRSILLPVDMLARILHVVPMTISRYRKAAVKDGLLRVVCAHVYSKGQATEFRFNVAAFPVLLEHAEKGTDGAFEPDA
jgi:hypothetical protein